MSDKPVSAETTYELEITSLTSEGEGVGRVDGFAIFVDGALPGEVVVAKVFQAKKRYARAKLVSIIKPSHNRQEPPCKYFSKCGGCQLMHLAYGEQLQAKHAKVEGAFRRIGQLDEVVIEECVPSPKDYRYRNKVIMPVVCDTHDWKIGFYEKKSHRVIDIDTCAIHNKLGDGVFNKLRNILRNSPIRIQHIAIKTAIQTEQVLVILVSAERNMEAVKSVANEIMGTCPHVKGVLLNIPPKRGKGVFGKQWKTLAGSSRIEEDLCGLTFEISGASFFQVNTLQAEQLYRAVLDAAKIKKETIVLDAYCGVGTLSLIAAQKAKHVHGIEMVPEAIQDAKINAKRNGIRNCTFSCGLTEQLIKNHKDVDVVIINPPRQGCDERVIDSLLKSLPKTIVYVSCDPTTLARDLALLQKGYSITQVQPFDMFPQTTHVETVATLHRLRH